MSLLSNLDNDTSRSVFLLSLATLHHGSQKGMGTFMSSRANLLTSGRPLKVSMPLSLDSGNRTLFLSRICPAL